MVENTIQGLSIALFLISIIVGFLFKSFRMILIALVVNFVPLLFILGLMGFLSIDMKIATSIIFTIAFGIAVDDTIHYIHRFNLEFSQTKDLKLSVENAHKSIGRAMFYTSTIIMVGFSVLVLSSFIPTIYFGLLTVIAMFMAIAMDLLLLPILLLSVTKK